MPLPLDDKIKREIFEAVKSGHDYSSNGIFISKDPFLHCKVYDFVDGNEITNLRKTCDKFKYERMSNDMYNFEQTDDISDVLEAEGHCQLRKLICNDLKEFIQACFGMTLNDRVHLTSSRYTLGDYLLCHNDLVGSDKEHRKIAFVLYVSSSGEGGLLDLFACDNESRVPVRIEKSLEPVPGSLSFFEVSDISYHQVGEILSADSARVSIHGWFHSNQTNPTSSMVDTYELSVHKASEKCPDRLFIDLINPMYLDPDVQQRAAILMNEQKDIMLPKFLNPEFNENVSKVLDSLPWKWQTPYNQRCYQIVEKDDVARCEVVQNLIDFFSSKAMLLTLSNLCDVNLDKDPNRRCLDDMEEDECFKSDSENCASKQPTEIGETTFTWELRRISGGCYTMLYDRPASARTAKYLWASLFFNVEGWQPGQGGRTVFAEDNRTDEVVHVDPRNNSLCIVYAKPSVRPFLLYRRKSGPPVSDYYQLVLVYSE